MQVDAGIECELARALEDADVPALVATLAHLTGDRRWLEPPYKVDRDSVLRDDPTGGLASEHVREVRAAALEVLLDRQRNGQSWSGNDELDPDSFAEIMSACVAEPVPPEYEPMVREEIGLSDRAVNWRVPPHPGAVDAFHVLIIGAGMSGLCTAMQLEQLGVPYTILGRIRASAEPGTRTLIPDAGSMFRTTSTRTRLNGIPIGPATTPTGMSCLRTSPPARTSTECHHAYASTTKSSPLGSTPSDSVGLSRCQLQTVEQLILKRTFWSQPSGS